MSATEQHPMLILRTVTENPATAVVACGCKGVYRTFKAIKGVRVSGQGHLECFVIIVSADLANRQGSTRVLTHRSSIHEKGIQSSCKVGMTDAISQTQPIQTFPTVFIICA